jgi:hypothetical protein
MITSREVGFGVLLRECQGALKICNHRRGYCESIDPDQLQEITCETDEPCPSGSYCFLGQCAPRCSRALDCPDSSWYCANNNQCRVLPNPNSEDSFEFNPSDYAIRFARKQLDLNAIQTRDEVELAIMSLITRQQVMNKPTINFGYRIRISYLTKEDPKCLIPFPEDCENPTQTTDQSALPSADEVIACEQRISDCIIDESEEWIRPVSPFGVVSGVGRPTLAFELEEAIVDRLSPGLYPARVNIVYDNGSTDEL